jgi:hypothetical protein
MITEISIYNNNLCHISRKQVKRKEEIRQERVKDEPIRQSLPEFKEVRKEWVMKDHDFGGKEYHFELLYYKYGRADQYLVRVNGKKLYYNRRGKIVLNQTARPVIMGLHSVHKLAMSKFHRVRRVFE